MFPQEKEMWRACTTLGSLGILLQICGPQPFIWQLDYEMITKLSRGHSGTSAAGSPRMEEQLPPAVEASCQVTEVGQQFPSLPPPSIPIPIPY